MAHWRVLIRDHRTLAMLLLLATLLVKAVIPAGYMVGPGSKILNVQICADGTGISAIKQIVIPMEHMPDESVNSDHISGSTCAFSTLSSGALGGDAAPILIVAVKFILLRGFSRPSIPLTSLNTYLRPPLRGPPARA